MLGTHDGGKCLDLQDGTGIIAGGGVRAVLEAAGVKNVLSKFWDQTISFLLYQLHSMDFRSYVRQVKFLI